jgi:excisionase family DNA binding protein
MSRAQLTKLLALVPSTASTDVALGGSPSIPRTRLMDKHGAGARLHVKPRTVLDLAKRGLIPSVRIGRIVRFRPEDIEAFIADHVQGGGK